MPPTQGRGYLHAKGDGGETLTCGGGEGHDVEGVHSGLLLGVRDGTDSECTSDGAFGRLAAPSREPMAFSECKIPFAT